MNTMNYEYDEYEAAEAEKYDAEVTLAIAAYRTQWPDYCQRCGGWGYVEWTEEHGERMSDYCEHCVGVGYCPRCDAEADLIKEENDPRLGVGICDTCGFELGATQGCPSL
jgi:DnaJ-class molecular chaperone